VVYQPSERIIPTSPRVRIIDKEDQFYRQCAEAFDAALSGPDGALVAMAGERLHPPGWTEISAVCTDEAWRGHGFASRLVRALVASIRARGETAFLHALADNTTAIGLYELLGFRLRRGTVFSAARVPMD
jgi:predicted GNAT family acetyltransferase